MGNEDVKNNPEILKMALERIISDRQRHGKLLGVLAHLEYVGARKISKALPASLANAKHLEHFMEEARHGSLLQGQCESLLSAGKDFQLSKRAEPYLQAVDRGISDLLDSFEMKFESFDKYLMVSLIIEERAMKFYPLYHRLLPEGEIKESIHGILKDEVGHLEEMQAECMEKFRRASHLKEIFSKCQLIEENAYQEKFWPLLCELAE